MTPFDGKYFLRFRIITSVLTCVFLLFTVNIKVDLHPNSVIVKTETSNTYLVPEIYISTGNDFDETAFSSGGVLPINLNSLKSFRIVFRQQPLFIGADFIFSDFLTKEGVQTSTWTALLPPFTYKPASIAAIILTPLDQAAGYELMVDDEIWPLEGREGILIAENPGSQGDQVGRILISKATQQTFEITDIRSLSLDINSVVAVKEEAAPVSLKSIAMAKNFSRLGFILPIKVWDAEQINENFMFGEPGVKASIDNGYLSIRSDEFERINLEFKGGLPGTLQDINKKINLYMILLNLLGIIFALVLFIFLGYIVRFLQRRIEKMNDRPRQLLVKLKQFIQKVLLNQEISGLTLNWVFSNLIRVCFYLCLVLLVINRFENQNILKFLFLFGCLFTIIKNVLYRSSLTKGINPGGSLNKQHELLIVAILLVINAIALFYRLGSEGFREDEFQVVDSAAGYLFSGQFARWDWIEQTVGTAYARAWPHTFLIAQSFKVFGISEWSARLVSVLGGITFFICLYIFARYFTNKTIALLTLFSASLYPSYLKLFRYTRMYALLLPLSLILMYCIYRGITGDWQLKTGFKRFDSFICKYFNYDYRFLIISIPLMYLTYLIHVNSLIIVVAAYFFVCALAIKERKSKYIFLTIFGLIIGVIAVSALVYLENSESINYNYESLPSFLNFISAFEYRKLIYLDHLVSYPFGKIAGLSLIAMLGYILVAKYEFSEFVNKYLYLMIIGISSSIFFIYVANRYASYYYISHITPISLLLIISGLWYFSKMIFKKPFVVIALLGIMIFSGFQNEIETIYGGESKFGDFETAYQVIIENFDYDKDIVFGQYLREYYLKDMDSFEYISMQNNRKYTYDQFLADIEGHDSGWLTWESRKSYHVDNQIIKFANEHFYKIHSRDVDDTGVEVFYFTPDLFQE